MDGADVGGGHDGVRPAPGLPRTSNDAEVRFERYKRRYRAMHSGVMSERGAQGWHTLWQVYANWEPMQVRKERQRRYHQPPGAALLERGGLGMEGVTWLDALAVEGHRQWSATPTPKFKPATRLATIGNTSCNRLEITGASQSFYNNVTIRRIRQSIILLELK